MSLKLNQKKFFEAENGSVGKQFVAWQAALWTSSQQNRELKFEVLLQGQRMRSYKPRGGANGHYGRPQPVVMKPRHPHLRKEKTVRGPRYGKV